MASTPNLPTPQSYEQILSDMLSAYASKLGINDFNTGSVNTSFFEVVALATARASGDLFQILRDFSVDRATGDALQRLAIEYNVQPISAAPATGNVNVIDTSFTKIFTKIYAGTNPPNIGSVTINVADASDFPASGSVYLGRGTPNIEGPLSYATPPMQVGSYWVITLTTPTAKFHNLGETVILAQGGNRSVPANAVVLSPGVGSSTSIQYSVTTSAIVLDGETEVDGVQVTALNPGANGNVPAGAITSFANPPFNGATVTNPLPFTTGSDNETDSQLRVRIKNALASQGLGTATAVKSALIGASATESNGTIDTIVSDSLITNTNGSATVYIDNGQGYEETSNGVGIEHIVDSALGGEQFFQLQTGGSQAPVAKAFLQSTLGAPFDIVGGDTLAVVVGGITYQHVFQDSDFVSPGGATAFEITASINRDTALGFEGTTAGGGVFVVIKAIAETNDTIFVTIPTTSGRDAALLLGFSSNIVETLRLYKNDIPLSKDGSPASVFTQNQQFWSNTIANGDTLILSVDGTAFITYTILNTDFIDTGLYTSVANTNSLASWVEVFNNKLTGVTASIVGQQIELTSNLGPSNRASISISGSSTLVSKGMFSSTLGLSDDGAASDFTLDRNTAQFELAVPLVEGDVLAAGSANTEAFIESTLVSSGNITFSSAAHIWFLIDTQGEIIPTGVINNTLLSVSTPSSNIIRYTSNVASAFGNVSPGDYVTVWSSELPSADRLEGRVNAVTGTTLDILITPAEWSAVVVVSNVTFIQGFVVLRSNLAPQRFEVPSGTLTLDQIVASLQPQTQNLIFTVVQEQFLKVASTTADSSGSILAVTSDAQGQLLQIADGSFDNSKTSLIAAYNSQDYTSAFPLFFHSTFASGSAANPPGSFITSLFSTLAPGGDPNNMIALLHPYGGINDAQGFGESLQETTLSGATIGVTEDAYLHRVRSVDRYYLANPLDFGHQDTIVAVLDGDVTDETFTIPLYRIALTNTGVAVNPFNFNAYDFDSGPTASFFSVFGSFDFSNFKVLMQAKQVLKPTPSQTAILYRSVQWGRSGEKITIAYVYPTAPNLPISSIIQVGATVDIRISLASGAVSPTSISSSTQWNVTVTANTPVAGVDQVTYTWNGVGTNPALSLSGGEYVNITTQSGFNVDNTGVFRVSTEVGFTPTATSFSVQRPNGVAVVESNIPTLVNNAITFYVPSPTTALQVKNYVNANLFEFVSATLVNDGGTSGSGVIVFSTYEDSDFSSQYVQLQDGINWIASSNLGGSPQFTFKNALVYPAAGPGNAWYTFNNGESIRLIPTTMQQVDAFISVLAVSGFTTAGSVTLVDRESRLSLATQTIGSPGSIQIDGGLGNEYFVPVLGAGAAINNTLMSIAANFVASQGVHSDNWFRLQASFAQAKIAGFGSNTSITVVGETPTTDQATISLAGRTLTQRNFGKPRNHVRTRGDTFRVEPQGTLTCISWTGVGTNPVFEKSPLNFNDSSGGTVSIFLISGTADSQLVVLTGNANFTELSIGDYITINVSGFSSVNNGTFLVTGVSDNGKTIQITNSNAAAQTGISFVAGEFTATSGVAEGDTVVLSSPFSILNQGTFRVIREFNNSIWIENPNVIQEEVSLPYNPVSLSFDGTTVFKVNASNNTLFLEWTGTGTEPLLGNAVMGDVITAGTDFSVGNQGSFMVLRSSVKLPQISSVTLPAGPQFTLGGPGTYFLLYSAGNVVTYYVWFNVNGSNSDPAPGGDVGIPVAILSGDTSAQVAAKVAFAISTVIGTPFNTSSSGNTVTITTTGFIETNATVNFNVPPPFSATTIQLGTRTFLEAIDPTAVNQASLTITNVLQDHRPQMQFSEYEASVPGDLFVATGNILGSSNAGSYPIFEVLNRDTVIVTGNLASIMNASLNNNITAAYISEGIPYYGYKQVFLVSSEPDAASRNILIFTTNAQYPKINQSADVEMTALSKLDYNTNILNGLDSYRFNTGLIAQANRIIYGDPRDPVTYPGVGAAGADIFVQAPLALRIQVAVDIRLLTGAPFNTISQQVRTNIAYLINSNPVGQSIDISSIVSTVRAIPGISSVAISSPQYSPTSDLIELTPREKALIIDPTTDISVDQIGA